MLLVGGIFVSTLSYAQKVEEASFWIEPSLYMLGNPLIARSVDLKYEANDLIYAIGVMKQDELVLFTPRKDDYDLTSHSLMVGKYFTSSTRPLLVEAGLSRLKMERDFDDFSRITIGVPVRITKYFRLKYVGFGLSAQVIFNDEEIAYSTGITTFIGKFQSPL